MSIKKMSKEELELLSNKDITNLLLEEKGKQTTPDLFKKIIKLLDLPESTFDNKIGDYYTSLTTDKRFILIDGKWDLRSRHTSDKVIKVYDEEDEEEEEEEIEAEEDVTDYDSIPNDDDDDLDDDDDDLKDLVVLDEDEMESE